MRKKLSSEIADQISDLINKDFFAGDRIPSEEELCKRFDVSRTTIREAIKELCSLNVLVIRRGVGTFVNETPGMIDDPFGWKYVDNEQFIPSMWETSFIIEPEMAALAAKRAKLQDINTLKEIHDAFKESVDEYKKHPTKKLLARLFSLDGSFHYQIAKTSGNVILQSFYHSYMNIIETQLPVDKGLNVIDSNLRFHELLIENIENGDPEKAKMTMYMHDSEVQKLSAE